MNILLVNPPTLYRGQTVDDLIRIGLSTAAIPYYASILATDTSKVRGHSTLPGEHLGLQSLQASLREAGHHVELLNACVELHTSLNQTLIQIGQHHFELIGFTGPLDVFAENVWLARTLRESGYTGHITLGHDFATLNHWPILSLYPEFDSVVRGEGELTMLELAAALEQKRPLASIRGLSFRDQAGRVVANPSRPALDLNQLAWVTRVDLPKVLDLKMAPSIYTKRGCLYQCAFCTTGQVPLAEGLHGRERWRQRSPKRVVDEIESLTSQYDIEQITIVDDLYVSKGLVGADHALDIAEELLSRQLVIDYMVDCRVDSIERNTFMVLKKSGLRKVFVGVESASEVTLSSFRKGYKPEIIRSKLKILEELEIECVLGYIFFNPVDTLKGVRQSYQLVRDLNYHDFGVFLQAVRIYPGTTLYRELEQLGLIDGAFPYYTARYLDPSVGRLRDLMGEFGKLAGPILATAYASGGHEEVTRKAQLYELISVYLATLLECLECNDESGVEVTFERMVGEFRTLI